MTTEKYYLLLKKKTYSPLRNSQPIGLIEIMLGKQLSSKQNGVSY